MSAEFSLTAVAVVRALLNEDIEGLAVLLPDGLPSPAAFRPDLALSLNNLSADLAGLGRQEDALAAIQEAVTIRRELAARWPDVYHQELERSLGVVAWLEASGDLSDTSPADLRSDNGPLSLPTATAFYMDPAVNVANTAQQNARSARPQRTGPKGLLQYRIGRFLRQAQLESSPVPGNAREKRAGRLAGWPAPAQCGGSPIASTAVTRSYSGPDRSCSATRTTWSSTRRWQTVPPGTGR
jgi:hypothetical protein